MTVEGSGVGKGPDAHADGQVTAGAAGGRVGGLWIGVFLGLPILLVGLRLALGDTDRTKPFELARWVVGSALVVDLVAIPLALGVGRVVRHVALRWALAAAATVTVVAWPFVRGYGRDARNPSLLPRSYGTGTAVVVGAVFIAALVWLLATRRPETEGP